MKLKIKKICLKLKRKFLNFFENQSKKIFDFLLLISRVKSHADLVCVNNNIDNYSHSCCKMTEWFRQTW